MRIHLSLFTLFLSLLLLTCHPLCTAEATSVSAKHAVVMDASTGEVLWEKEANTPAPMASTTKIMTAVVVLNTLPLQEVIAVPKEAVGVEGTSAYLKEGELLTVSDLLHALLLSSANDAAVTLAIATAGSISAFAEQMNRLGDALGLTKTHFVNPHGLPDEEHYTTARELALITAYAMHIPTFREIVGRKSYTCHSSLSHHTFLNHNKLLHMSRDAVGVKTGFTKRSGRCLVGAAERDGSLLISVTLNAPNDWRDHMMLWEYGFALLGIPKETEHNKQG